MPLLYTSSQQTISQNSPFSVIYEIRDTYKYPFYLFTLNEDFLRNFDIELKKIDARIKSIGENSIEIEKILQMFEAEVEKKCLSDIEDCLNNFLEENFNQFQMKNTDENLWPKIRNKAIHLCKNTNKLNLIYQNKPDKFLRIEGEKKLIEKFLDENFFLDMKTC